MTVNKYSELSDPEVNALVKSIVHPNSRGIAKDYCNSWADAVPIIEKNKINIEIGDSMSHMWFAYIKSEKLKYKVCSHVNFNPLRAAMEVFLMMEDAKNEQHLPQLPEGVNQ